jgi:hypothetical protein
MSNTLQQQITADAQAGGVFFSQDGNGFEETITHYPAGDLTSPASVLAIIDLGAEDTGGAGGGEGLQFDNENGVKLRHNAVLSLPVSVAVTESSGRAAAGESQFDFYGYRWRTLRIIGRDGGIQDVLVTRLAKISTRRVRR